MAQFQVDYVSVSIVILAVEHLLGLETRIRQLYKF